MGGYKLDIPVDLSEKTTDKLELAKKIVHLVTFCTDILTICILAPLIAIEARYLGAGNAGPGYALFVAITSLPIPFLLVYFPWMYEKYNKFKRLGKFCLKNRTNLIFCGFNTFMWATAGIAITVQANNPDNCVFNADLIKQYGDAYNSSWGTQCNLAKVAAGFSWITCILWLVTLAITGIAFWKEKTLIQERLNEHRLNKQSKLEERQQDVEYGGRTQSAGFYEDHDASPFTDQHQEYHSSTPHQSSPFAGPHHSGGYHTPVFDGNQISAGQYHAPPPAGFSPMPEPQHVLPPAHHHPEPSYYNNQHF